MQPILGDFSALWNQIVSKSNLDRSFDFAIYHRTHSDFFYDPFEIESAKSNRKELIEQISYDLESVASFKASPAFAYFPSKNDLCYRRMIYLPFKDLLIRYAIISVIADCTDAGLYNCSFANRRCKTNEKDKVLLEHFATKSWPDFCSWQKQQITTYSVLLKTDISAFYDSISHEYLIAAIAAATGITLSNKLMNLLVTLLRTQVISYSRDHSKQMLTDKLRQGLCIGNAGDGFLANLYLKETDTVMENYCKLAHIAYARYNDDIRIFARDKSSAKSACLLMQQYLLTKGLNLNASKTMFAEGPADMEKLISSAHSSFDYFDFCEYEQEEEEEEEDIFSIGEASQNNLNRATAHPATSASSHLQDAIDKPFDQIDHSVSLPLKKKEDAKKFCHFMHKSRKLSDRTASEVKALADIIRDYPENTKFACWLLAQSSGHRRITQNSATAARESIIELIKDSSVADYAKYRLLHHLTKLRSNGKTFANSFPAATLHELDKISTEQLDTPSIELGIAILHYKVFRKVSKSDLEKLLQERALKPIALHLQNILLRL